MAVTPIQSPVIQGLRTQYPGYDDIPDSEFMDSIKEAHYPEMKDEEFMESLESAYGKAPEPARPSVGAAVGGFLKEAGKGIVEDIKSAPSAIGRGVAQIESPMPELPDVGYSDLIKRGYKPEVAQNVMKQRISTQQEMSTEMGQQGAIGQEQGARGAAAYLSAFPAAGAEALLAKKLGAKALEKGLGWVAKHAVGGATGIGVYEGLRAAGEGKSASEIYNSTLQGVGVGAIAGPILAKGLTQVGAALGSVVNIPRYVHEGMTIAAAKQRKALETSATEFANRFSNGWMRSRFQDLFDPSLDPKVSAVEIMSRVLGKDVAEIAPTDAINEIARKIAQASDLAARDPSFRPVQAASTPVEAGPSLTPTLPFEPQGGMAPEPNVPAAAQGSIAEAAPQIPPPGGKRMAGLQGTQLSRQVETPFEQAPLAPAEGAPPAVQLRSPLGAQPEAIPQAAIEPNPADLGPSPVLPRALPNEIALPHGIQPKPENTLVSGVRRAMEVSGSPEEQAKFKSAQQGNPQPGEGLTGVSTGEGIKATQAGQGASYDPKTLEVVTPAIGKTSQVKAQQKTIMSVLKERGTPESVKTVPLNPSSTKAYWMTPEGKLFNVVDHEDVSSKAVKALKINEKNSGYEGNYRWDNHAMLQRGFHRIQVSGNRVIVQSVAPMSFLQQSTMAQLIKGRHFGGVITELTGAGESNLFERWGDFLRASERKQPGLLSPLQKGNK